MTAFQLSPISGDYVVGKGRLYLKVSGATQYMEIGDVDAMSMSQDNQRLERFTNQYGARTKTDSRITQQNANLGFTMVQSTARNLALAMMSDKNTLTQAAGTTQLATLTSVQVGDVIDTGKLSVSVATFTDGATSPLPYVATTNYTLDSASGMLKVVALPGSDTSATLKVYYPAITASTKQLLAGLGQNPDLTAEVVFVSLDANSVPIEKYTFWSVKLSPDGDVNLISDEYRTVQIKGEIVADTTQATGYQLGKLEQLVASTNTN
jgi:hypothetical protein